jgi:hypothetical protein
VALRKRAPYCEFHREWCHLGVCADCHETHHASEMYFLLPPVTRAEGAVRICVSCMQALRADALLTRLR